MKVLVPSTIALNLVVDARDEIVPYDAHSPIAPRDRDADVLVVWQNPPEQLRDAASSLRRLRLVQTLASGADAVLAAGFAPDVAVCSGRSLHDGPVAEHLLAVILAAVRRLDVLERSRQARRWDLDHAHAQSAPETATHYTLNGARVTIWGYGSIAARLAPMLDLLGAQVRGLARTAGTREGIEVVSIEDRASILRSTDILVSLVPASDETDDLLDAEVFSALPPGAIFVNAGRGSTVDEDALIAALRTGQLRAAAIDVAKEEPLPPTSPLWDVENLIITPHVAGNRPVEASLLVDRNLAAVREGRSLTNRVR